jgi:aminomethyltransferase
VEKFGISTAKHRNLKFIVFTVADSVFPCYTFFMADEPKKTPLWTRHTGEDARMVNFAGWEMPVQYPAGAIREHKAVRGGAGVFDICHMGRFEITGAGAVAALDRVVSGDVAGLSPGSSVYGLLCREDGGILDDVFVYRLEKDRFLMVVNAINREKDRVWLGSRLGEDWGVSVTNGSSNAAVMFRDVSEDWGMLAVQGPRAVPILQAISADPLGEIPRFGIVRTHVAGVECLAGRTGYTGEDGVELYPASRDTGALWDAVRKAGIPPVGLAARDSLRFEPGFSLYGHEICEDVTPVEARLTWACCFERPFTGRDAVLERKKTGPAKRLVTFVMKEKGVPREGFEILGTGSAEENKIGPDTQIGRVVTGMYAPTVNLYAGNAYVDTAYSAPGTRFRVRIRDRSRMAAVVKRPLYTPRY